MAFINANPFTKLSSTVAWVGGLLLDADESGTISFNPDLGEIALPEDFRPQGDSIAPGAIRITAVANGTGPFTNLPLSIGKAGDTVDSFVATLTNTKVDNRTQSFEVYVELIEDRVNDDGGGVTINVNVTK